MDTSAVALYIAQDGHILLFGSYTFVSSMFRLDFGSDLQQCRVIFTFLLLSTNASLCTSMPACCVLAVS